MASLDTEGVRKLLEDPNCAVISTLNRDGSILSTVIWVNTEDGALAVNSAIGRRWPTNLLRDPRVTVLVYENGNPYNYAEIRGTATATRDGAVEHIHALAKKYTGEDEFSFRNPNEDRIKFVIAPDRVRHEPDA